MLFSLFGRVRFCLGKWFQIDVFSFHNDFRARKEMEAGKHEILLKTTTARLKL